MNTVAILIARVRRDRTAVLYRPASRRPSRDRLEAITHQALNSFFKRFLVDHDAEGWGWYDEILRLRDRPIAQPTGRFDREVRIAIFELSASARRSLTPEPAVSDASFFKEG
jgi:hypothetical protein